MWLYYLFGLASCAYVRVNQVGFVHSEEKSAFYLSESSVADTTKFEVVNSQGTIVHSGIVGSSKGAWNTAFGFIYELVFTPLNVSGTYQVRCNRAISNRFAIGSSAAIYSRVIGNTAFYFKAQRDGSNVDDKVFSRKPSHLVDKTAKAYEIPKYSKGQLVGDLTPVTSGPQEVDVEGGWFDAGDYIKFVQTTSYTTLVMLLALRDVGSIQTFADFDSEAKFGVQWLLKMWDNKVDILYYQVGIGDGNSKILGDHDLWRLPEHDDTLNVKHGDASYYIKYRPALRAGPANSTISPNLAGRLAAVFGLCAQIYETKDPTLAKNCLSSGEKIYSHRKVLSKCEAAAQELLTASPFDYYPETEWCSDLEIGAVELYYATKDKKYLTEAQTYANNYISFYGGATQPVNLYDVGALAHLELARAVGDGDVKNKLISSLESGLATAEKNSNADAFGVAFKYTDDLDAAPMIMGQGLTAGIYNELTKTTKYRKLEHRQRDYVFGANGWGTSFIVGAAADYSNASFPHCLQHQIDNLKGSRKGVEPMLLGAVVDGPTNADNVKSLDSLPDGGILCPPDKSNPWKAFTRSKWEYLDDARSWATSEPADDYTIMALLFFARLL